MTTPSHFLMTLALAKFRKKAERPVHATGFLLGSVAPDVPLTVLTLVHYGYLRLLTERGEGLSFRDYWTGPLYDALYFDNLFWVFSHNLLHAPLLVGGLVLVGYWGIRSGWRVRMSRFVLWFGLGCALHSFVDILTHHSDGPLVFFPFEWTYRFASPVSYWDAAYYGDTFSRVSDWLNLTIIAWVVGSWLWQRVKRSPQTKKNA